MFTVFRSIRLNLKAVLDMFCIRSEDRYMGNKRKCFVLGSLANTCFAILRDGQDS